MAVRSSAKLARHALHPSLDSCIHADLGRVLVEPGCHGGALDACDLGQMLD